MDARRAINEARMRIQGSEAFIRFWERVLTPTERDGLGNDVDACIQSSPVNINLLCELRGWIPERAIVEIAHKIGFLTSVDYQWLRDVVGDPLLAEASSPVRPEQPTPSWDRESGRLEYDGELCRTIRTARATSIVPILDAFQAAKWQSTVDYQNETVEEQRIHQVVRNLNSNLTGIRFNVQDQQICWQPFST